MKIKNPIILMLYVVSFLNLAYSFIGSEPMLNLVLALAGVAVAEAETDEKKEAPNE